MRVIKLKDNLETSYNGWPYFYWIWEAWVVYKQRRKLTQNIKEKLNETKKLTKHYSSNLVEEKG